MFLSGGPNITSIKVKPIMEESILSTITSTNNNKSNNNNNNLGDIDPFKHVIEISCLQWVKIVLMSFTIAPLRLICIFLLIVLSWIISVIGMIGIDDMTLRPLGGWRKKLQTVVVFLGRAGFFCLGVHKLKVIGEKASRSEAPIVVGAPHATIIDALAILASNAVPVAKYSLSKVYFLGRIGQFQQVLFVNRGNADARLDIREQISNRATDDIKAAGGATWRQLFIFPEGTCTNGKAIVKFKTGAFQCGLPVQIVLLRFANRNFPETLIWTWFQHPTNNASFLFWLTLCQFQTSAEIEYLPIYVPTAIERENPRLFADNVQRIMAKHLQAITVARSVDDVFKSDDV